MPAEALKNSKELDPCAAPAAPAAGNDNPFSRLRFNLAGVLRLSERLVERAVSAYDNTFRLDHEDTADIYLRLATDEVKAGRAEQALAALQRVISLQPGNAAAWYETGLLHLKLHAPAAALEALERAQRAGLEGFEGFDIHFHLAEALGDLERHEQAADELVRALKHRPDSAPATYRLGMALDRLGRYEEAAVVFKKAIECAPREVNYHQSLGFTLECLGRRDEAIECFKKALELQQRAER